MNRPVPDFEQALSLAGRVDPQYRPVWEGRTPQEQAALALYFLPHSSSKAALAPTRPRVIKWYCPFARQAEFPSGHRYCINVYTGCAHRCEYCYAYAYAPPDASCKRDFQKMVLQDLEDLDRFDVPPAPVHMSNSTDPFQPLEVSASHARYALEQLAAHRRRLTTVTILTKNPLLPVRLGCLDLFKVLAEPPADHPSVSLFQQQGHPGLRIEVSLAFWREEARAVYDPGAPTIEERKEGIRALRQAGIPLVLRIDPLFPQSPLGNQEAKTYEEFGIPQPQTSEDIEALVRFAKEIEASHVVYSAAKIVQPRGRKLSPVMQAMRKAYESAAAPGKLIFRGGAWRLPDPVADRCVTQPFLQVCERIGVKAKHCKRDLIETP